MFPSTIAPVPDVDDSNGGGGLFPPNPVDPNSSSSDDDSSGGGLSSIALGGIGILLICVVAGSIIGGAHYVRQRYVRVHCDAQLGGFFNHSARLPTRVILPPLAPSADAHDTSIDLYKGRSNLRPTYEVITKCLIFLYINYCLSFRRRPHMSNYFVDVEPTYRTEVIRSQKAPNTKFDNIMFDSDRHPSGVYDVPASASTTPGVSRVAPPDFASHVKVDVEDDDDDDTFADANVIVPTEAQNLYKNIPNTNAKHQRSDEASALTPPARLSLNLDLYADLLEGDRSSSNSTLPEQAKSNDFAESRLQMEPFSTQRVPPSLPPRTQSMLDEMDLPAHDDDDDDVTRPQSLLVSSTSEAGDASSSVSPSQSHRSTLHSQASNTSVNAASSNSSPQTSSQKINMTVYDDVANTTTDYYRSMLRHQPVSGVYDNNMENMPNSPYCLQPSNFPY